MTPIIVAMRAPVLSATSSLERIWTINLFADDFDQTPPLQLAGLLQLSRLLLQAQMQTFLPQVTLLRQKLVSTHLNKFLDLHGCVRLRSDMMTTQKFRSHRQFVGSEAQRLARDGFRHAIEL